MRKLQITQSITNRESASFERYLQEISKEKLLTIEEEIELAQRINKGDQNARELLIKANLRFVISVAKQYQNQGLSLPDLISEGNIGLIKAAGMFDEKRGFKFISYAVWWIRQAIMQALASHQRIIRLPLNQIVALNKINKAYSKFEKEYERIPTAEEISMLTEISKDKLNEALKISTHCVSLDMPFYNDEEYGLLDVLINPDAPMADYILVKESLLTEVERTLAKLAKRERDILRYAFGLGVQKKTLDEIAGISGFSRERVRQIKAKAIRHLRQKEKNKHLKGFLG